MKSLLRVIGVLFVFYGLVSGAYNHFIAPGTFVAYGPFGDAWLAPAQTTQVYAQTSAALLFSIVMLLTGYILIWASQDRPTSTPPDK